MLIKFNLILMFLYLFGVDMIFINRLLVFLYVFFSEKTKFAWKLQIGEICVIKIRVVVGG